MRSVHYGWMLCWAVFSTNVGYSSIFMGVPLEDIQSGLREDLKTLKGEWTDADEAEYQNAMAENDAWLKENADT